MRAPAPGPLLATLGAPVTPPKSALAVRASHPALTCEVYSLRDHPTILPLWSAALASTSGPLPCTHMRSLSAQDLLQQVIRLRPHPLGVLCTVGTGGPASSSLSTSPVRGDRGAGGPLAHRLELATALPYSLRSLPPRRARYAVTSASPLPQQPAGLSSLPDYVLSIRLCRCNVKPQFW